MKKLILIESLALVMVEIGFWCVVNGPSANYLAPDWTGLQKFQVCNGFLFLIGVFIGRIFGVHEYIFNN